MPRKTHKIKSKKTILLIVEGYTEKIYFSQMKFVENNQNVTIIPRMAKHSSLVTILETAIKEAKEKIYDSICNEALDRLYVENKKSIEDTK